MFKIAIALILLTVSVCLCSLPVAPSAEHRTESCRAMGMYGVTGC